MKMILVLILMLGAATVQAQEVAVIRSPVVVQEPENVTVVPKGFYVSSECIPSQEGGCAPRGTSNAEIVVVNREKKQDRLVPYRD